MVLICPILKSVVTVGCWLGGEGRVCSLTCALTVVVSRPLQRPLPAGEAGLGGGGRDRPRICPVAAGVERSELTAKKFQSCPKAAQRLDWLRAVGKPV